MLSSDQIKRMEKAVIYISKHPKLFPQVNIIDANTDLNDNKFFVAGRVFQLIKRLNNRFPLAFTNKELRIIVKSYQYDFRGV